MLKRPIVNLIETMHTQKAACGLWETPLKQRFNFFFSIRKGKCDRLKGGKNTVFFSNLSKLGSILPINSVLLLDVTEHARVWRLGQINKNLLWIIWTNRGYYAVPLWKPIVKIYHSRQIWIGTCWDVGTAGGLDVRLQYDKTDTFLKTLEYKHGCHIVCFGFQRHESLIHLVMWDCCQSPSSMTEVHTPI